MIHSSRAILLCAVAFAVLCGALGVSALSTDIATAQTRAVVRDGSLIRLQGTTAIYAVQIDYIYAYKRYIPSNLLSATDRSRVINIRPRTFGNYIESNLVIEVNNRGEIIDGKVYMIQRATVAGQARAYKRHLNVTPEQFTAAGFRWNAIFPVTSTELSSSYYLTGTALTASDLTTARTTTQTAPATQPSSVSTPTQPTAPTQSDSTSSASQPADSQTTYYTSAYPSARYYYPADCSGWRQISPRNLVQFNSVEELLAQYSRSLSPSCQ